MTFVQRREKTQITIWWSQGTGTIHEAAASRGEKKQHHDVLPVHSSFTRICFLVLSHEHNHVRVIIISIDCEIEKVAVNAAITITLSSFRAGPRQGC